MFHIFSTAAGILFREGLEALLVVIALVAGTREAGHENRTKDIYVGALIAVAASIALAWGVNHLISDDASDTLEGIFQVLAAATLFYVSSWLTSKSQAQMWKSFINDQVKGAQESAAPGLALALTAFLAVIREGAETIVFFQALTVGATEAVEKHAVMAGIAAATVGARDHVHRAQSRGASNPIREVLLRDHHPAVWTRGGFHRTGNRELPGIRMDRRDLRRARADDSDARPLSDGAENRRAIRADRVRRCVDDHSAWLGAGGKGGSGSFCPSDSPDLICGGSPSGPPSPITMSSILTAHIFRVRQ